MKTLQFLTISKQNETECSKAIRKSQGNAID